MTFKNNEKTHFFVIFSNLIYSKDLENAQTFSGDDEVRVNVTNMNFANCVFLNKWIKPGSSSSATIERHKLD